MKLVQLGEDTASELLVELGEDTASELLVELGGIQVS